MKRKSCEGCVYYRPYSCSARGEWGCHYLFDTDQFLSTPSARRATFPHRWGCKCAHNFYPRPPRGGRHKVLGEALGLNVFLSTPSARRATSGKYTGWYEKYRFLSTPSARRATSA